MRAFLDAAANVAVIAVAVAIVWAIVFRSDGPPTVGARGGQTDPLPAEPLSLDQAQLDGNRDAKVVMIAYSDFQCPFCARFSREALPEIRSRYVTTGKLLIAFRHLPLADIHPLAVKAAEAAECAGRQGRFWQMHDALFMPQVSLELATIRQVAATLGLQSAGFNKCLTGEAAAKVQADAASARKLGVTGTPTFFIGTLRPDGLVDVVQRLTGALPISEFAAAIDPLVAREAAGR